MRVRVETRSRLMRKPSAAATKGHCGVDHHDVGDRRGHDRRRRRRRSRSSPGARPAATGRRKPSGFSRRPPSPFDEANDGDRGPSRSSARQPITVQNVEMGEEGARTDPPGSTEPWAMRSSQARRARRAGLFARQRKTSPHRLGVEEENREIRGPRETGEAALSGSRPSPLGRRLGGRCRRRSDLRLF